MNKVMILGGYGTFGSRIAELLVRDKIPVVLVGRNAKKLDDINGKLNSALVDTLNIDAHIELDTYLQDIKPNVLINTIGPFQNADYKIAKACIKAGVHYIDLADAREYVNNINVLDANARENNIAVISGASTVPTLSSAVLEYYAPQFDEIETVRFGISPGQRIDRGLATTRAILGYVGKRLKGCAGHKKRFGWQDNYRQKYTKLRARWMANCDVPDLDLLPEKFGLKSIQFSAGMELSFIHFGIWGLGWLRRLGLPLPLEKFAPALLKASKFFNFLGTDHGAMHVTMQGIKDGESLCKTWFIYGFDGDGPYIPCAPAVVLAKVLLENSERSNSLIGATPALSYVTLEEYVAVLSHKKIETDCID